MSDNKHDDLKAKKEQAAPATSEQDSKELSDTELEEIAGGREDGDPGNS